MEKDPISKWANEAQKREEQVFDKILTQDTSYYEELESLRKEFQRVKEYNLDLKLQIIETKEKLHKILQILNK
tara:strand:+ start:61 stop:279 length:219 start_codon:yes stop_codon:yes gene_type:complete